MNTLYSTRNILITGDRYVGKSAYIDQLLNDKFGDYYCGNDFEHKHSFLHGGVIYNIIDMPGNTECKKKYKNVHGAILMFSYECSESYINLQHWISKLDGKIPFIIIGNKIDTTVVIELPKKVKDVIFNTSVKFKVGLTEPLLFLINNITNIIYDPGNIDIKNKKRRLSM